ncbi:thiol:disulfide interchange protein DsbA [Cellvibrio zantedeschiae]|uniref:Thiol:disulfide interchange protein n=1 Tax=Cellvibrio zantedeschiae TaxID=1237077 RepID=A0ABQ3BCJ1_9GAMM|nr:thiol:disulfide interchange protein DsbA/DsbL [Cellvibrio zantedeschiae]GGY85873.1 thiol:disulfide interchange protein DsbA [Cellvibrio zantedeschiae]
MRMFAALVGLVLSASVAGVSAAGYTEGKDYSVLPEQVKPADASKIEVAEVFSFLCPHCYHFEPLLQAWSKKQPADVVLVQTHASFNHNWPAYQRGFYTISALGVKDKVQEAVFSATYVAKKEMLNAEAWADFLSLYGVDKQKTISTYNSFGVNSQMKQADNRVRDFKINQTPTLIVDGRFKVLVANHEEMLKVTQFLVDKVRAERAAKR